jgi:TolA-binding protein
MPGQFGLLALTTYKYDSPRPGLGNPGRGLLLRGPEMRTHRVLYRAIGVLLCTGLAARYVRADAGDDQYAVAAAHYANGRWQLASDEFQSLLKHHADHSRAAHARFFVGEALVQLGRHDAAMVAFVEYLSQNPTGRYARQALFRSGEAAHFTGRRDAARQALVTFRDQHPTDALGAYAQTYLGQMALDAKDSVVAEMHFAEGLKLFGQSAAARELRYGLARALELQRKFPEAATEYRRLAEDAKEDLADAAHYRLGLVLYSDGKYDQASETLSRFDERFPTSAIRSRARYWLGVAQKAQKAWDAAARTFITAAETFTGAALVPAMRFQAGDALAQAGKPREALVQFDAAIAAAPGGDWADDAALRKLQALLAIREFAAFDEAEKLFQSKFASSTLAESVELAKAQSLVDRARFDEAIALLKPRAETAKGGSGSHERAAAQYLLATAYVGQGRHGDALPLCEAAVQSQADGVAINARRLKVACLAALSRYDDALAALDETRGSNGDTDAGFQADLAVLQAAAGRGDEARRTWERFTACKPTPELRRETLVRLADAAYRAGNFDWAEELYTTRVVEGPPESVVKARIGQATCRLARKDAAGAAELMRQVLAGHPNDANAPDAALLRGRALEKLGDAAGARAAYENVVEKYGNSDHAGRALVALARLHSADGKSSQAATAFERLSRDYPAHAREDEVVYTYAWALRDANRADEALKMFEQLAGGKPPGRFGHDAAYRVAELALERRDYDRAGRALAELVAAKPEPDLLAYAFYLQSQIAVARGEWKQVSPPLEQLVKQCPASSLAGAAKYWQAEAAYRQEMFDEAQRQFEKLALHKPAQGESWPAMVALRRAQLLARQKKWQEAYDLAVSIEKDFPKFAQQHEADYLIGRCLIDRAQLDEARSSLAKVVQSPTGGKTETAAMAQWMIGETYFHQERFTDAIKEYLRVEILYPYPQWQAAGLLQAAKAHEKLGQHKDATTLYAQLLQKYGQTNHAQEAAQRLRDLTQRTTARATKNDR